MSSKSRSSNTTRNSTTDRRQAVSDEAIAIQGRDVTVHQVADEAFELGELAITEVADTLGRSLRDTQQALYRTQDAARTESAQLAEQLIKFGIPAAALAYVVGRMVK